jgi:hypothetical protein
MRTGYRRAGLPSPDRAANVPAAIHTIANERDKKFPEAGVRGSLEPLAFDTPPLQAKAFSLGPPELCHPLGCRPHSADALPPPQIG